MYENYSKHTSYYQLLEYLFDREFIWMPYMELDSNRAYDGIGLRQKYTQETNSRVAPKEDEPCTVLEMMIALSIRCEIHIMDDDSYGNRTGQWFWSMIVSLGLGNYVDDRFNIEEVESIVDSFLHREYKPNGKGGLFTIDDVRQDLSTVEIWYQMNWYVNKILYDEGIIERFGTKNELFY